MEQQTNEEDLARMVAILNTASLPKIEQVCRDGLVDVELLSAL